MSRADTYSEVEEKAIGWLEAGTPMVVLVNGRTGTVTVYRSRTDITIPTEKDTLEGDDIVPGWLLPLEDLFG